MGDLADCWVTHWHAEEGVDRPLLELRTSPNGDPQVLAQVLASDLVTLALERVLSSDPNGGRGEHAMVTLAMCAWPVGSPDTAARASVCAGCDGPILDAIVSRRVGFLRFHDEDAGQVTVRFTLLDPAQAAITLAGARALLTR